MINDKGTASEVSLMREYEEALQLYKKRKPRIEVAGVELQEWQKDSMKLIKQDNGNNIIIYWISGAKLLKKNRG